MQTDALKRSPGKILLFGEHAAVYQKPAIGLPVSEYLELGLSSKHVLHDESISSALTQCLDRIDSLLPDHGLNPSHIAIEGDLPISAGYGSSASFARALVSLAFANKRINEPLAEMLWPLCHEVEKIFHATPSGIDTGIVCHEGLSLFTFDQKNGQLPNRHMIRKKGLYIVHFSTKREGSTKTLVAGIRQKYETIPQVIEPLLAVLGSASLSFAHEVRDFNSYDLCKELVREAQKILAKLGLLSPAHEVISDFVHNDLRMAGKMSGAGAGGVFYVLAREREEAVYAQKKLSAFLADRAIESLNSPSLLEI